MTLRYVCFTLMYLMYLICLMYVSHVSYICVLFILYMYLMYVMYISYYLIYLMYVSYVSYVRFLQDLGCSLHNVQLKEIFRTGTNFFKSICSFTFQLIGKISRKSMVLHYMECLRKVNTLLRSKCIKCYFKRKSFLTARRKIRLYYSLNHRRTLTAEFNL